MKYILKLADIPQEVCKICANLPIHIMPKIPRLGITSADQTRNVEMVANQGSKIHHFTVPLGNFLCMSSLLIIRVAVTNFVFVFSRKFHEIINFEFREIFFQFREISRNTNWNLGKVLVRRFHIFPWTLAAVNFKKANYSDFLFRVSQNFLRISRNMKQEITIISFLIILCCQSPWKNVTFLKTQPKIYVPVLFV